MVSDARVTFYTADGELIVSDQLLNLSVSDSLDALPTGSITLPLRRTDGLIRKPYKTLITPGDLCLVEMFSWDGSAGGWTTVLHGPVAQVLEREVISNDKYEVATTVQVGSMSDILNFDVVAWWMYFGTIDGYAKVRASLSIDQMSQSPHRVMFDYLKRVAFDKSAYANPLGLGEYMNLDFDGIEAMAPIAMTLTAAEGTHLSIISQYLDAPLHELYTTTKPISALQGTLLKGTAKVPGEDGGATTLTWRKAPYPYLENGSIKDDEWTALPLHTVEEGLEPIRQRGGGTSRHAVRNFFIAYPAHQWLSEQWAYSIGACYANYNSVHRFGYSPLKMRTHLVTDYEATEQSISEFMHSLTGRIGGQWNMMHRYENGQVQLPLNPQIRPGERLRAPSPWADDALYEYHIRGRKLDWNPVTGGSMPLVLERGLPVAQYQDPAWLADGLEKVRVGGTTYASGHRLQDEPGN